MVTGARSNSCCSARSPGSRLVISPEAIRDRRMAASWTHGGSGASLPGQCLPGRASVLVGVLGQARRGLACLGERSGLRVVRREPRRGHGAPVHGCQLLRWQPCTARRARDRSSGARRTRGPTQIAPRRCQSAASQSPSRSPARSSTCGDGWISGLGGCKVASRPGLGQGGNA
jgi:hypothetical protein